MKTRVRRNPAEPIPPFEHHKYRVKETGEIGWLEGVQWHVDTPNDKRFILKFVDNGRFIRWDTFHEESIEKVEELK